jgi:hypothetical protein
LSVTEAAVGGAAGAAGWAAAELAAGCPAGAAGAAAAGLVGSAAGLAGVGAWGLHADRISGVTMTAAQNRTNGI